MQNQQSFKLQVITPQSQLFAGDVASVNVPGAEGDFSILPSHANIVSDISPGIISIYAAEHKILKQLFVYDGVADVQATRTILFLTEAVFIEDINIDEIKNKVSELEKIANPDDKMLEIYRVMIKDLSIRNSGV